MMTAAEIITVARIANAQPTDQGKTNRQVHTIAIYDQDAWIGWFVQYPDNVWYWQTGPTAFCQPDTIEDVARMISNAKAYNRSRSRR